MQCLMIRHYPRLHASCHHLSLFILRTNWTVPIVADLKMLPRAQDNRIFAIDKKYRIFIIFFS